MNVENKQQRWANLAIAAFVVSIVGAFAWDVFSPGSMARIIGFALLCALCILLRALGPKFLVPKQKK
jgi:hypothetical protein